MKSNTQMGYGALALAGLCLLLGSVGNTAQAAVVFTEDFESYEIEVGSFRYFNTIGDGWNWTGFTVTANRTALVFNGTYNAVGDGEQSVQLEYQGNYIEQAFSTIPGQTYTLSFLLSGYGAGIGEVAVDVAGQPTAYFSDPAGIEYTSQSLSFTATSVTTTLRFTNNEGYPFTNKWTHLDNICVRTSDEPLSSCNPGATIYTQSPQGGFWSSHSLGGTGWADLRAVIEAPGNIITSFPEADAFSDYNRMSAYGTIWVNAEQTNSLTDHEIASLQQYYEEKNAEVLVIMDIQWHTGDAYSLPTQDNLKFSQNIANWIADATTNKIVLIGENQYWAPWNNSIMEVVGGSWYDNQCVATGGAITYAAVAGEPTSSHILTEGVSEATGFCMGAVTAGEGNPDILFSNGLAAIYTNSVGDTDGDGFNDDEDNCPDTANEDQANNDGDDFGDACDLCPTDPLDQDLDGDGICDVSDLCVGDDGTGDSDGDQVCDDIDVCQGNDATGDTDGDEICDGTDNCPSDINPFQEDFDGDQLGDVCDADDDGDGTNDDVDNCPDLFNFDQANSDDDELGDACDPDDDNDGTPDGLDNCPVVANPDQADLDGDGDGDACDGDDDADGVADEADLCPATPMGVAFGDDGCSGQQSIDLACEGNDPCGFSNHGKYQSCVVHAANAARNADLLTNKERAAIVRAAAKTHCGD